MPPNILVVDDEESIRYTFDAFLSEEGYEAQTAASLSTGPSYPFTKSASRTASIILRWT